MTELNGLAPASLHDHDDQSVHFRGSRQNERLIIEMMTQDLNEKYSRNAEAGVAQVLRHHSLQQRQESQRKMVYRRKSKYLQTQYKHVLSIVYIYFWFINTVKSKMHRQSMFVTPQSP